MQYNANAKLDSSQVEVRSGGNGSRVALGGGVTIVVLLLALVFGINPNELLNAAAPTAGADPGTNMAACQTGADVKTNRDCRFVAYANTANAYWTQAMGARYQPSTLVLFSGSTPSGCGTATTAVGPFYCPSDKRVYIDPSFTTQMLQGQLGGQGGDAAEAYVVGHEYGHHVQDLSGILAQVQASGSGTGAGSAQVNLELQADCLAGAYLAHVAALPNSPIATLSQDDLNRAADAARVVGDDYIQKRTQGSVNADGWTHGSSAQRQKWLAVGFQSGDPAQCTTFGQS